MGRVSSGMSRTGKSMAKVFWSRRLLQAGIVLVFISLASFFIINAAPGDPALALYGDQAQTLTASERARINSAYGVDKPVVVRYMKWLGNVLHGDLGVSYKEGETVTSIISDHLVNSLYIFFGAVGLIVIISLSAAWMAAAGNGRKGGLFFSVYSVVSCSIPPFWLGMLLIFLFSLTLGWLPTAGIGALDDSGGMISRLPYLIMPVLTIVLTHAGLYARFILERVYEEKNAYHVKAALANGVPMRRVAAGIVRNASIPWLNYLGVTIPGFFGGSVVIETLFAWPGIGMLAVNAAVSHDYPVLMGTILIAGTLVTLCILVVDVIMYILDPRIRLGETSIC